MLSLDDTTTVEVEDDEDKTLVLNGVERLKYFNSLNQPVQKPLSQRQGLLQRLKSLFR